MAYLWYVFRSLRENRKPDRIERKDNGIIYINAQPGTWLEDFIKYNFPCHDKGYDIAFIGVDSRRPDLSKIKSKKVFFSGENVDERIEHKNCVVGEKCCSHWWFIRRHELFSDYMIDQVDLSMGFKDLQHSKYLRLPLWILYLFPPNSRYDDIKRICDDVNSAKSCAIKDAVCLNKHDIFGTRTYICDELKDILCITYPGLWRHNSDELWNEFNNDKLEYLKLFRFNICPENMDSHYYVTEKIIDSFRCGCIPIYAGAGGNPEPECFNKNAFINWNLDGDNKENKECIKRLLYDNDYYNEFMHQEKLKPYAVEYVWNTFCELKKRFGELID